MLREFRCGIMESLKISMVEVNVMAINKDEVIQIFDRLPESAQQSAFDYLQYLSIKHNQLDWDDIAKLEPDATPLSEEEERQLNSESGFISWEEAMDELNLPTDNKS